MPSLNFFQQQEDAKVASRRTMLLFPVAVFMVLLFVSIFFAALFSQILLFTPNTALDTESQDTTTSYDMSDAFYEENPEPLTPYPSKKFSHYFKEFMTNPWFLAITWSITLGSIVTASWAKILELSSGDWVTGKIQDGTCRYLDNSIHKEKRLANIAEEIAIAAGIHTPEVLLLEREKSINAFITVSTQKKASLFITAGCLERLDREELQAIVAHELSHLVNGSLKNNIQMIGLLSGISILYELGLDILGIYSHVPIILVRGGVFTLINLAVGISLLIIGSSGVFSARLIKKATNRRRALLADAATVQFTRSTALSRVLLKIAVTSQKRDRSIHWFNPEPISHLCFTDPFGRVKPSLLSAHPSLQKRAKSICSE